MSYIHRAPISENTKEMVHNNAARTQINENGEMVSPNGTGKVITDDTKVDIGHDHSFENRYEVEFSSKAGLTQEQHNQIFTNPGTMQIEPQDENRSHQYENKNHNDGMQNVSAYAYSQDKNIAANTFINPSEDGKSGTISVIDENGQENTICSYALPGNSDVEGANLSSGNDLGSISDTTIESSDDLSNDDSNIDSDDDYDTV